MLVLGTRTDQRCGRAGLAHSETCPMFHRDAPLSFLGSGCSETLISLANMNGLERPFVSFIWHRLPRTLG